MKRKSNNLIHALILTVLVPWLLFNTIMLWPEIGGQSLPGPAVVPVTKGDKAVTILVLNEDGCVVEMELEDYLLGVVRAEMPEAFHSEALKAQAVVARTYTLRMRQQSTKHADADVCVRAECCQGYRSGDSEIVRAAVDATAGQVLTYDGELIEATYFSSSGGRTESAVAVWGSDIPYLQSVESPELKADGDFLETVTWTIEEFRKVLGVQNIQIESITYTDGGGVDTITIGDRIFKGTELRKLLGLRSTEMAITAVGDHIIITTKGFGHRVGMSQYGAETMAGAGDTYDVILDHYYPGTTLELFVDKESTMG